MLAITSCDSVTNAIYGSYAAKLNYLTTSVYLNNAATPAQTAGVQMYLRSALAENTTNSDNVTSGLSLIDKNHGYLAQIADSLTSMKQIASSAATGSYTSAELAAMQTQLDNLAADIDDIAQGPIGETHILTSDSGFQAVFIGSGLSIDIASHDMTSGTGLDLAAIDVASDANSALSAINTAIAEVDQYTAYLETKHDSLTTAASSLETQKKQLFAMESAIQTTNAALLVAQALEFQTAHMPTILVIMQANFATDTVVRLLGE